MGYGVARAGPGRVGRRTLYSAGMIIRFVFFITFWAGLNAFLTWRFLAGWDVPRGIKIAFCLLVIGGLVVTPLAFTIGTPWLKTVAFLMMGFLFLAYTLIVLRDLALIVMWLCNKYNLLPDLVSPERRALFKDAANWGVLAGASSVGLAAAVNARQMPDIQEVSVPIKNLPEALEGFSIAQVSDIHIGSTVRAEKIAHIAEQVQQLKPDMYVITGDLIDGSVSDLGEQVKTLLNVATPHGTYFCTGNHEYYSGALRWCDFLEQQGVKVLNNAHDVIEVPGGKIMMAGVTDLHGARFIESHRCQPGLACEGAPADADVKILLAHQPKVAFLTERGQYDLQLSGHTHGGQYFPYNFLIHLVQKYVAGLYRHEDMWVYVNRGTTFWGPPMRLGPEQEITLLKLRRLA